MLERLNFFKHNKITTPSAKQVMKNTVCVAVFSLIVGVFVWLTDIAAYSLINGLLSLAG